MSSNFGSDTRLITALSYYLELKKLKKSNGSAYRAIRLLGDVAGQLYAKDGGINSEGNLNKGRMLSLLRMSSKLTDKIVKEGVPK